jgi:hypothetical protein
MLCPLCDVKMQGSKVPATRRVDGVVNTPVVRGHMYDIDYTDGMYMSDRAIHRDTFIEYIL